MNQRSKIKASRLSSNRSLLGKGDYIKTVLYYQQNIFLSDYGDLCTNLVIAGFCTKSDTE